MTDTKLKDPQDYKLDATQIEIKKHILTITLNRPEKKNAINDAMSNEIIYALKYASEKEVVR